LRIIAGERRGKTLKSVRGMATRPTADRVRESVFNILSHQVRNAAVLDLFAGTGAMGIEALSRGADAAVFIDDSRDALSVIRKNLEDCRFQDKATIIHWNIEKNLNCLSGVRERFDLVFMDPPYNKNLIVPALGHLLKSNCLKDNALIVIEHGLEQIPADISDFCLTDQRKYGKTLVSFFKYDMNT
jgi:16S rRNA (guanine966-N2)-methyltransferase